MSKNAGYLFYKKYYIVRNYNITIDKQIDKDITIQTYDKKIHDSFYKGNKNFKCKTIYPGLLIGSGYNHDASKENDAFKIGFFFDHATGLPVIPGSSVKGVIRSWIESEEYFRYLLSANKIDKNVGHKAFIERIFEGRSYDGIGLPMRERDIFLDAYPITVNKKIFGKDYITPHKHPLKNPIPLRFLKVMPSVEYQFNFILRDDDFLTADEKLRMFKMIILDVGVGAKTNVGYGKFKE